MQGKEEGETADIRMKVASFPGWVTVSCVCRVPVTSMFLSDVRPSSSTAPGVLPPRDFYVRFQNYFRKLCIQQSKT